MHRFDAFESSPRTLKRAVALCQPGPLLYRSMVLFNDIVEILALAETNAVRKDAFGFQSINCSRIGWVLIDIDYSRNGVRRRAEYAFKEAFGGGRVALRRKQKVNNLPGRIHGSIQILVMPLNLYIGLVDTVALLRALEMRLATLVQFRRVDLYPTPDTTGIHFQAPLSQEFGDMLVGQRISQVPPYGLQNSVAGILASLEWIRRRDWHGFYHINLVY